MLITKALFGLSASAVRASEIAASHSLSHILMCAVGVRHRILVVEQTAIRARRGDALNLREGSLGEVPNVPLEG